MAHNVVIRPFRILPQAELDSFLEKAADMLRGNVDHSEFRDYVFALLSFKRISDVHVEDVRKLTEQLGDDEFAKDPKMHNFVVPDGCFWDEMARKSRNQVGTALNEAMIDIERTNQPKLDGILTSEIDFNQFNPNLHDPQVDGWLGFSCFRGHRVLWIGNDPQSKDERTISVRVPLAEGGTGARRRIWHGSSSPRPRPSLIQGGV